MDRITLSAKNLLPEQRQAIGALFARTLADDDRLVIRLAPADAPKKPRISNIVGGSPWPELKRIAEAKRREKAEQPDTPAPRS